MEELKNKILREAEFIFNNISDMHHLCYPTTNNKLHYDPLYIDMLNRFKPYKGTPAGSIWFRNSDPEINNLHRVYALLFMAAMCDD